MKEEKKSVLIECAIEAVIDDSELSNEWKVPVLALLFDYRSSALFSEKLAEDGASK